MTNDEILEVLSRTRKAYRWQVRANGQIVGRSRNHGNAWFSPLGAVARFTRQDTSTFSRKQRGLFSKASCGSENRGFTQVLRGRIRQALGV